MEWVNKQVVTQPQSDGEVSLCVIIPFAGALLDNRDTHSVPVPRESFAGKHLFINSNFSPWITTGPTELSVSATAI